MIIFKFLGEIKLDIQFLNYEKLKLKLIKLKYKQL